MGKSIDGRPTSGDGRPLSRSRSRSAPASDDDDDGDEAKDGVKPLIEDPRDVLISGPLQLNQGDVDSLGNFPTDNVAHNVIWYLIKDIIADDRVFVLSPMHASLLYRSESEADLREAVVLSLQRLIRGLKRWAMLVPIFRADLSDSDLAYAGHASVLTICKIGPLEGSCALHFDSLRVAGGAANAVWAEEAARRLSPLCGSRGMDVDHVDDMPKQRAAECVYMMGLATAACVFKRNQFPTDAEHIIHRVVTRARPSRATRAQTMMEARYQGKVPSKDTSAHARGTWWDDESVDGTEDCESTTERLSRAATMPHGSVCSQSAASSTTCCSASEISSRAGSVLESDDSETEHSFTARTPSERKGGLRRQMLKRLERAHGKSDVGIGGGVGMPRGWRTLPHMRHQPGVLAETSQLVTPPRQASL
mmetsp:Transcript_19146/g.51546  ORF Transcript_19146/g.51546 Transcript_19146/m.51546 type:complete len:421 (-) Transcript_19146:390-1652(-)